MAHPVQTVLESLYAAERCPRLHVNAMTTGVVCPDFIRDQWKDRLVIDLDASYPLALEMDDDGLSADLSFGGYVSRCSFPWAAIYVVSDRDSGRGIVLEQNVPASVRAQMDAAKRPKPRLAAVEDADDDADDDEQETGEDVTAAQADRPEPGDASASDSEASPDVEGAADAEADDTDAVPVDATPAAVSSSPTTSETSEATPRATVAEPAAPHTTEEQERAAQRRRAAFRVIDGGS